MRIFGGERVKMIMERVGMEDGEPIEHKYTTRAIENAQKKVEAHNFDIRKHLLEFDDVMNKQREVVLLPASFILGGEDLKGTIQDMIETWSRRWWSALPTNTPTTTTGTFLHLVEALWGQFGVRFNFDSLLPEEQTAKASTEHVLKEVLAAYERKETEVNSEVMRELEKYIMLQAVDNQWKRPFAQYGSLEGRHRLRGYGQRDPLKEYQREGL